MTSTPKPRHRWFQFRLRTLLVLMLLACIGMGWVGVKVRQARKQRAAAEEIERLGGIVTWMHPDSQIESRLRSWLEQLVGDDFLAEIQLIFIENDAAMEHLKELTAFRGVGLSGTQITDTSLKHLSGLNQLQELYLYDTQVTDAGLEYLKALSRLRCLSVAKTQLTDAGLEHLKTLTQLRRLDLNDTQVSDSGVRELQKALPNCRICGLVRERVLWGNGRAERTSRPVVRYRSKENVNPANPDNCDSAAVISRWDHSSLRSRMNRIIPT